MEQPFVKICGLSTAESVDAAVEEGANAVGFVFAPSPRLVSASAAHELVQRVPNGVETVGVFRGQPIDEVLHTASDAGVSTIQFHGHEPLSDLTRASEAGFQVMRAFAVDEFALLGLPERALWEPERLLIDAIQPGSGRAFDPALLTGGAPEGWWLLAGGLHPANVAELIEQLQPSGVDVSSGVEESRGVKSPALIRRFIRAVRR